MFMPKLPQSEDCLTSERVVARHDIGGQAAGDGVDLWRRFPDRRLGSAAIYSTARTSPRRRRARELQLPAGQLGFFAHPALTARTSPDAAAGNYAAARPDRGAEVGAEATSPRSAAIPATSRSSAKSAGGMTVQYLIASPLARGLFAKAISESGLGLNDVPTFAEARKNSVDFRRANGCDR